jgi:hypothetical protein
MHKARVLCVHVLESVALNDPLYHSGVAVRACLACLAGITAAAAAAARNGMPRCGCKSRGVTQQCT